ncbi:phosphoesterase [Paraburkholderia sp. Tr-20389]|uniref:alkaline phosphatase family protein n=1 Tax=Paraburkholderia sp. Tr-20389 TaxID=2703903 RepID=UPI0019823864|nr:alkaline phosphatase family protein [Paraburkholderia sp. Tr-20389]MBN3753688.1 phosphoesterase [Paraburkholderia sp. Tr-20389]
MANLSNIKHIVVLMLENRSFDNVFGFLQPASSQFDGLKDNATAGNDGVAPWTRKNGMTDYSKIPSPDPGESFKDIQQQIFNGGATPTMGGFRANYAANDGAADDIMHCFQPDDLPVLSQLATSYAVSDRWFASAPCQTWPNRFFAHAGTAHGYENNAVEGFPFPMQTIFNELDGIVPWKIYFHDFPQAALLSRLWPHFDHFRQFSEFLNDAAQGHLPGYSFIEPMYYPNLGVPPNDMHPPHDVEMAEALVAKVYNAVRASPNWTSTLLVITFDEHGGCFDHVPPPAATMPEPPREGHFAFNTFGVRVPAVVISPYTKSGTVLRPQGSTPFDHTSIIRTVRNCFGIAGPLSAREAAAPDLSCALNDEFDANRSPVAVTPPNPGQLDVSAVLQKQVNDLQDLLQIVAVNLKRYADEPTIEGLLQRILESKDPDPPRANTAGKASETVRSAMEAVLAKFSAPGTPGASGNGANNIYRGH